MSDWTDKNPDAFKGMMGIINEMKARGELPVNYNYNFDDDGSDAMANNELYHAAMRRRSNKTAQTTALDSMRAPEMESSMQARIKALEDDSKHTSLAEDPYFQGNRAQLVTGGEQALAQVNNQKRAQGVSGGFQNVGSVSDIYDRMGTQMAALGQQSTEMKDKKSAAAAEARQSFLNSQIEYENAVANARAAIQVGDSEAAAAAMQNAINAKSKAEAASRSFWGSIASGALSAAGAVAGTVLAPGIGTAIGAGIGKGLGSGLKGTMFEGDFGEYAPKTSSPWSLMRNR